MLEGHEETAIQTVCSEGSSSEYVSKQDYYE